MPEAICLSKSCEEGCAEGGVCLAPPGQPSACLPTCASVADCPSNVAWTCEGGACQPRACHGISATCADWRSEKAYVGPTVDPEGPVTVEAWLRTEATAGKELSLIDARSKFTLPGFGVVVFFVLGLTEEGGLEARLGNGAPVLEAPGPWSDGEWHHVAAVWSHQGSARLWLDGALVAETDAFEMPEKVIEGANSLGYGWRVGFCDPLALTSLRVSAAELYQEPFEPAGWLMATADTRLLWRAKKAGVIESELGLPVVESPPDQTLVEGPDGPCPDCEPACAAKACGPDKCGSSCGVCPESEACDGTGSCNPCIPNCDAGCGDDGCGGVCAPCDVTISCLGHPDGTPCPSDGDPCTTDSCQAGACASIGVGGCPPAAAAGTSCSDGTACAEDLTCEPSSSGPVCTVLGCQAVTCPAGSVCSDAAPGVPACLQACEPAAASPGCDSAHGFACNDEGVCAPQACGAARFGDCAQLETVAPSDAVLGADAFTLELWLRAASLPAAGDPPRTIFQLGVDLFGEGPGEMAVPATLQDGVRLLLSPTDAGGVELAWRYDLAPFLPASSSLGTDTFSGLGWHHVAVTSAPGPGSLLWLDGELVADSDAPPIPDLPPDFLDLSVSLGAHVGGNQCFDGDLALVRLSSVTRYSEPFEPPHWLAPDADTLALWPLSNATDAGGLVDLGPDANALSADTGVVTFIDEGPSGLCECIPTCAGKLCGDDGCGGSCGGCVPGEVCSPLHQCQPCVPSCADAQCGDDGCGGACGECALPTSCGAAGLCDGPCVPQCGELPGASGPVECGDDQCGGTCGTCQGADTCSETGHCIPCVPSCEGLTCTADGCGGICGPICPDGGACLQAAAGAAFCADPCDAATVVCPSGGLCVPVSDVDGDLAGYACLPVGDVAPWSLCSSPDDCGPGLLCGSAVPEAPAVQICLPGCDTAIDACPEMSLCVPVGQPDNVTGACLPCAPVCHANGSVTATCNPTLSFTPKQCATEEKCIFDASGNPSCTILSKVCNVDAFGCTWTLDMLSCSLHASVCSEVCDPGSIHCVGAHSFACDDAGDGYGPIGVCGAPPGATPACQPGVGCTLDPDGEHCFVDGALVASGSAHPSEPCLACDPTLDGLAWSVVAPEACDDGDPCTEDTCKPTGCETVYACDDGEPCTEDTCDVAGCLHAKLDGLACEDGDPCTSSGSCSDGTCAFAVAVDCDDGNMCTLDGCSGDGCSHFWQSDTACDSGAACADPAVCDLGLCMADVATCAPCPPPQNVTEAGSWEVSSIGGAAVPWGLPGGNDTAILFELTDAPQRITWYVADTSPEGPVPRRESWDGACGPISRLGVTGSDETTWTAGGEGAVTRLWWPGSATSFTLVHSQASVTVEVGADAEPLAVAGTLSGVLAGDPFIDALAEATGLPKALLATIVQSDVDLDGDGVAEGVSITVAFTATPTIVAP